jgi:ATP-dependent DNA helicase RecG
VVANLLVHREFSNAFPAKFIIEEDHVVTENWNRPHGHGLIDPAVFSPFPKNPVIAKFFKEIGWVDELGSGVRNTFKYATIYNNGKDPLFEEGDVFKTIIPTDVSKSVSGSGQIGRNKEAEVDTVNDTVNDTINDTVNDTVKQRLAKIILLLHQRPGMRKGQLVTELAVSDITLKRDVQKLKGLVEFRGAQKTGGYYLTEEMENKLKK